MNEFLKENKELASALENLLVFYRGEGRAKLFEFRKRALEGRRLVFSGMGTSEFTPMMIEHRLSRLGVISRCIDAGELLHYEEVSKLADDLFIFTSQSGETVEVKKLLHERTFSKPYIAITNCESCSLANNASLILPLCAGNEQSITTKTFTNNLALLHILATIMENLDFLDKAFLEIETAIKSIQVIDIEAIRLAAAKLLPADMLMFIARGPAIVNAKQCALTFMEGTRCVASAFTGGAFNHGPFESVEGKSRLIIFAPTGKTQGILDNLIYRLEKLGPKVVVITDRNINISHTNDSIEIIKVGSIPEAIVEDLFPIIAARTHNLLLYEVARRRGIQAGMFRYGKKVTTDE
jgi:glucosamine--fructose-6-phosphate aminotransferase (isomerizing)